MPIGTDEDTIEMILKRALPFEKNPVNALETSVPSGAGWLVAVELDANGGLVAIGQVQK